MGIFLESEKRRQAQFKIHSPYFSDVARFEGIYSGLFRPFCLPAEFAEENLFLGIRERALAHFAEHRIKWHSGQNGKPSNHLCSSQVSCVNFLFPLADQPELLAHILRTVYPSIKQMVPVEGDRYVSFEWIGKENYLGEKVSRSGQRHRGALFTSADAIVAFERKDAKRQIVLIEWKYAESYPGTFLKYADSGTDRTGIYRPLFEQEDCPIDKGVLKDFDSLFYEPFYQFMRQQFLANEMEKAGESDANLVTVLHIAPAKNTDFCKITSPQLKEQGGSAVSIWRQLLRDQQRFVSVSTEYLFGNLSTNLPATIQLWRDYIYARYPWVCTQ